MKPSLAKLPADVSTLIPGLLVSFFASLSSSLHSFPSSKLGLNFVVSHVQLLCDPMACSPPCSSVHGIFQARILEWVAISFSMPFLILTQGLNPSLLNWQVDFLPLSHQGSPLLNMPNTIWGLRIQIKIRCSTLLLICL